MKKNIFKKIVISIWRFPYCFILRKKIKNKNFVILSSNCIGGVLLHDLGLAFDTPTINLTISPFVSFCENWEKYLSMQPVFDPHTNKNYPVFRLEDIQINAIHYKNKDEFLSAWNRRKDRFLKKIEQGAEIIIFSTDTQMQEKGALDRFDKLPYKKISFWNKKMNSDYAVSINEFKNQNTVGDLTRYSDIFGRRYFEKYFDCVKFINEKNSEDK